MRFVTVDIKIKKAEMCNALNRDCKYPGVP